LERDCAADVLDAAGEPQYRQEYRPIAALSNSRGGKISITTLTSWEFNQDTSRAKKAARSGQVVNTDRGNSIMSG
jgi:hypothetical protein